MNEQGNTEMPRYRCHKEVHALKIESVVGVDGGVLLTPTNARFAPFTVSNDFASKHDPKPGGYFVLYKDGYKSFSPAEAFEDGYTLIA